MIERSHRHLSNTDCLMVHTACLVCFISTVNGRSKKRENALEDVALVPGAQQNLSNLYSIDINERSSFIYFYFSSSPSPFQPMFAPSYWTITELRGTLISYLGPNLKHFLRPLFIIWLNKLECLIPGRPFQPSLMCTCKARRLPKSRAP